MEQETIKSQIRMRDASEADVPFLFNSWLKCYRSSKNTEGIQNQVFFAGQHKVIEGLLRNCKVVVASNTQDSTQIFGYIVYEFQEDVPVIHFVYVKEAYRKMHLATVLLEAAGIDKTKPFFYTHRTLASDKYHNKFNIVYHPYLAYYAYRKADDAQ